MRIVLLAPLPPEQTGIADYAAHFCTALRGLGIEVLTPLAGCHDLTQQLSRLKAVDWSTVIWCTPNSVAADSASFSHLNT